MKKIFLKNTHALFLFLIFALFFAGTASANHAWGGYHWARTTNPFTLKLGDNLSVVWHPYLVTTSADWSLSNVLDTTIVKGISKGNCQPTKGRIEVCNKNYGNTGWLGVAQIWVSGNHITQAITKMNDTYFSTSTYNNPAFKQFVMCQEVGHTFGLDHQDEIFNNINLGSCMDYTNDPSGALNRQLSNLHPNQHDYDQLGAIYAHLDNITTISSTTLPQGNAAQINSDDPSAWGKSLRNDGKGKPSVFGADLGHGEKVFTFVIWVNEVN